MVLKLMLLEGSFVATKVNISKQIIDESRCTIRPSMG